MCQDGNMEAEYPFHTAFLLLLLSIVAVRMYFSGYADAASGVTQNTKGEGAFRVVRIVLGIPLGAAILAYSVWPPLLQWSHVELAAEMRWTGLLAAFAGLVMLISVHRHLSMNFTGTVQIRPKGNVVKTGPYFYVRHPMYWSFLLLDIGMFLLTANWLIGGGFLLVIVLLVIVRLPVEEAALLHAYGEEYAEYAKRTGRFFPRISSFIK